ncbi:hypothetical protein AVEN_16295-1 [Araneus ventricosus]|uniref:Uncharacterized protein n=1 Tax=Araneus ventricosus TaxID=182803 RepID=A0A4Y2VRF9_ARAVE|nr:hypothetical protein AVEN_16295-1 [Araneus ventricosus]
MAVTQQIEQSGSPFRSISSSDQKQQACPLIHNAATSESLQIMQKSRSGRVNVRAGWPARRGRRRRPVSGRWKMTVTDACQMSYKPQCVAPETRPSESRLVLYGGVFLQFDLLINILPIGCYIRQQRVESAI